MAILFDLILITTILCLSIKISTSEGMWLERLGVYGERKIDEGANWVKPLFACEWCMPSLWTLVGFAFAFGIGILSVFSWQLAFFYPLVVGGSSIVTGIIWNIITYLSKING